MAKKKAATKKKAAPKKKPTLKKKAAPKMKMVARNEKKSARKRSVIAFSVGPFATAQHLDHQVHAHLGGKACRLAGGAGVSNNEYAYNMAPGFEYHVRHRKRHDKRCELVVRQGPYVGIPFASRALGEPGGPGFPVAVCFGLGCEISPCPADKPVPNCETELCVAMSTITTDLGNVT